VSGRDRTIVELSGSARRLHAFRDLSDDRRLEIVRADEDAALLLPRRRGKAFALFDLWLETESLRGRGDLLNAWRFDRDFLRNPPAPVPRASEVEIRGIEDDRPVALRHRASQRRGHHKGLRALPPWRYLHSPSPFFP